MTEQPLVSVLMTTYNREQYLVEAIESILASCYKNFELIIVDDHSNNNTAGIAKAYELRDKRIKVYINATHLGDYANRNQAASYASGKYLKYVDSDDYIYPHGLSVLVNAMEEFPGAGWGICSLKPNTYINHPYPFELTPKKAYEFSYLGPGLFSTPPLCVIIKRDVFLKVGGFLPHRMVADLELWHRLAQKHNVVLMQDGIVWIRQHHHNREMKDYRKYLNTYERIKINYLTHENCALQPEQVKKILKQRKKGLLNQVFYYLWKMNFRFSYGFLQLLVINFTHPKNKKSGRLQVYD
jgi:glycosyltransferase involved in cell wall biosynthesis